MINLFCSTLKASYFENLIGSSSWYFTNVVIVPEMIEQAIKVRKISDVTKKKRFIGRRRMRKPIILRVKITTTRKEISKATLAISVYNTTTGN